MRFCPALAAVIVLAISATPADLLAQQRPPIDGRLLPLATDTFVVLYGDMVIGQSIMQRFAEEERLVQVYTWRASTGEVIVDSLWTDHRTLRPIREARVAGANVEEVMFGPDTLIVVRRNAGRMSRSVLPNQPSAYSSASLDALAAALDLRDGLAQDVLLYYAPPASLGYVTTRVEVQRSERVRTTDGQESDAWVLAATTPGGGSTFWIDKATRALLMFDTQEGDATIHFRR